jgi:hypothetical protein
MIVETFLAIFDLRDGGVSWSPGGHNTPPQAKFLLNFSQSRKDCTLDPAEEVEISYSINFSTMIQHSKKELEKN